MEAAKSESRLSLLSPQPLAKLFLPPADFHRLQHWATEGVPAQCGPDWLPETIVAALEAGPHTSATTPSAIELILSDISHQVDAGFADIMLETELLANLPPATKVSRVATVPQTNRRDRIILNLSAEVAPRKSRRSKRARTPAPTPTATSTKAPPAPPASAPHPSVNDTTTPAPDQTAVKDLGNVFRAVLLFMFVTDPSWPMIFSKLDLSDGFWRMLVAKGSEFNFIWQLPQLDPLAPRRVVIPSALQMGWKNSPAFFCTVTLTVCLLLTNLLRTCFTSWMLKLPPHPLESHFWECLSTLPSSPSPIGPSTHVLTTVFVDDFILALAAPQLGSAPLWLARCALHAIHSVFPPPSVTGHIGGKDSVSIKKLEKGDAVWSPQKEILGFLCDGSSRCVSLPPAKCARCSQALLTALGHSTISFGDFQRLHGKLQHVASILPVMRGFMTPLNAALKAPAPRVGLGKHSELREVLLHFHHLLLDLQSRPTHIWELVPPHLPHVCGFCDASSFGAGGVWLPCTVHLPAIVWRLAWPSWVTKEVQSRQGQVTNSDVEMAAAWLQWHLLACLLRVQCLSSWIGSDNSPTVGWATRMASKAASPIPERFLRSLATTT